MPIKIRPIKAVLNCNPDLIGDCDPYIIFLLQSEKKKTQVCKNGGRNPQWKELISFQKFAPLLLIQVWDYDMFKSDDLIGVGTLNMLQFVNTQSKTKPQVCKLAEVTLVHDGEITGLLEIEVEIEGNVNEEFKKYQIQTEIGEKYEGRWSNCQDDYY